MQPNYPTGGTPGSSPNFNQNNKPKNFVVPFIVSLIIAILFLALFAWAYITGQDYKNNVDTKVKDAVKVAVELESQRKDNEFLEKEKQPYRTFKGPETYGSLSFDYPKNWSVYVDDRRSGNTPLNAYFHPISVPSINSDNAFALRVKIIDKPYSQHLNSFESKVNQGKVKTAAFKIKNQPSVIGVSIVGEVNSGQQNKLVLIPLRDKTIEISTESDQFRKDFDNILESLNFTP